MVIVDSQSKQRSFRAQALISFINGASKLVRACALTFLSVVASEAHAADILQLRVSDNGGVYHISLVTEVDAPAEYVHRVLTDYVHIHRLNPSITESDILSPPGNGAVRVRTRIRDCVLIFCMELDRVEDVFEVPPYDLYSVIVPEMSNFRSGKSHWHIRSDGERSKVSYDAEMQPDFLVVPLIGPSFIKDKLRKEMTASLARIECIAKIEEELDWNIHLEAASVDVDAVCGQSCDSPGAQCPP